MLSHACPQTTLNFQVVRHGRNNYIADTACTTKLPFICKKFESSKKPTVVPVAPPTTVRHLREDWKQPPQCKFLGNNVELYQHPHYHGWKASFGSGSFRNLDDKVCDNDKKLCEVRPCNARPNSLTSLKIPAGKSITLFDQVDFKGSSITLYGPKHIPSLSAYRWNDRAESIRVRSSPPSKWLMRTFRSTHRLRHQPNPALLQAVGTAEVPWVTDRSGHAIRQAVRGTPHRNYEVDWSGNTVVKLAGTYQFCSESDDGSRVFVDGKMIVNNGGLHGRANKCGDVDLKAGTHAVHVSFFQGGGGAFERLTYRGPDTGGAHIPVPSVSTSNVPAPPAPSLWTMKVFREISPVNSKPQTRSMDLVGTSNVVRAIDFHHHAHFRKYVPTFPHRNLAVIFYGNLKIQTAGDYNFCLKSADGSYLYVNGAQKISNGGRHGVKEVCNLMRLKAGMQQLKVFYWRRHGTPWLRFTYQGPDTGASKWIVNSDSPKVFGTPSAASVWLLRQWWSEDRLVKDSDSDKLEWLQFVGQGQSAAIDFRNRHDLAQTVQPMHRHNVAWRMYGKHKFKTAGLYTFCLYNSYSAALYMDKTLAVDNRGHHGARQRCRTVNVDAKEYLFQIKWWYRHHGGPMRLTFKGPDTGGNTVLMDSSNPGMIKIPKPVAGGYGPGKWPMGWCHPPDAACLALGIKENMCGKCVKTATGFKLENTKRGLRWGAKGANAAGAASFDDNFIRRGSTQAKNLCILAKYGNKPKGPFPAYPTANCAGRTQWGKPTQTHWCASCLNKSYIDACMRTTDTRMDADSEKDDRQSRTHIHLEYFLYACMRPYLRPQDETPAYANRAHAQKIHRKLISLAQVWKLPNGIVDAERVLYQCSAHAPGTGLGQVFSW